MFETITVTEADGVAIVTLDRPEVMNALNAALRRELTAALRAVAPGADSALARTSPRQDRASTPRGC